MQPEGEERQSLYGTIFGFEVDKFKELGLQVGDKVEAELLFSTTERNGYVNQYVEFRNVTKWT